MAEGQEGLPEKEDEVDEMHLFRGDAAGTPRITPAYGRYGKAFYLTTNPKLAQEYAHVKKGQVFEYTTSAHFLNLDHRLQPDELKKIREIVPLEKKAEFEKILGGRIIARQVYDALIFADVQFEDLTAILQNAGFDGIYDPRDGVVGVYKPELLKPMKT